LDHNARSLGCTLLIVAIGFTLQRHFLSQLDHRTSGTPRIDVSFPSEETSNVPGSSARAFDFKVLSGISTFQRKTTHYRKKQVIFYEGDGGDSLFYIERGSVKLTITSAFGKDAVVGVFDGGSFVGEGCLSANPHFRPYTATALTDTRTLKIGRISMLNILRTDNRVSTAFTTYLLDCCEALNQDLASSLVNPSEKRLARALLMFSQLPYEVHNKSLGGVSQQTLADMIGSTRQRVNMLLRRFKREGFIENVGRGKARMTLRNMPPDQ
jgi:CRP-like cAMP-binding protein